jgi:hypothetical protein
VERGEYGVPMVTGIRQVPPIFRVLIVSLFVAVFGWVVFRIVAPSPSGAPWLDVATGAAMGVAVGCIAIAHNVSLHGLSWIWTDPEKRSSLESKGDR